MKARHFGWLVLAAFTFACGGSSTGPSAPANPLVTVDFDGIPGPSGSSFTIKVDGAALPLPSPVGAVLLTQYIARLSPGVHEAEVVITNMGSFDVGFTGSAPGNPGGTMPGSLVIMKGTMADGIHRLALGGGTPGCSITTPVGGIYGIGRFSGTVVFRFTVAVADVTAVCR